MVFENWVTLRTEAFISNIVGREVQPKRSITLLRNWSG